MEELKQETKEQEPRQLRGLYSKVKISVRTLNIIIVVLIIASHLIHRAGHRWRCRAGLCMEN